MTKEQELNKKLAEWAGFKENWNRELGRTWDYPDGSNNWFPIDFTQSLDACFKWLVPKAVRVLAATHYVRIQKAQEILFRFWLEERWKIDEPNVDTLALCLAIEELIRGEGQSPNALSE